MIIMAVPVLGASFDGHWNTAKGDYAAPLSALSEDNYRVLWLGHPDALPGKGQKLTDRSRLCAHHRRERAGERSMERQPQR